MKNALAYYILFRAYSHMLLGDCDAAGEDLIEQHRAQFLYSSSSAEAYHTVSAVLMWQNEHKVEL